MRPALRRGPAARQQATRRSLRTGGPPAPETRRWQGRSRRAARPEPGGNEGRQERVAGAGRVARRGRRGRVAPDRSETAALGPQQQAAGFAPREDDARAGSEQAAERRELGARQQVVRADAHEICAAQQVRGGRRAQRNAPAGNEIAEQSLPAERDEGRVRWHGCPGLGEFARHRREEPCAGRPPRIRQSVDRNRIGCLEARLHPAGGRLDVLEDRARGQRNRHDPDAGDPEEVELGSAGSLGIDPDHGARREPEPCEGQRAVRDAAPEPPAAPVTWIDVADAAPTTTTSRRSGSLVTGPVRAGRPRKGRAYTSGANSGGPRQGRDRGSCGAFLRTPRG